VLQLRCNDELLLGLEVLDDVLVGILRAALRVRKSNPTVWER
jgi:hypothetical protein